MSHGGPSTKFHIICSDQPRNGKTLVARLLCDFLILSKRPPLIFDAAPTPGGLRGYFPARASKVELSTTAGQMALFDRALAQPRQDCVVDLPAHLLTGVVEIMRQIGFGEETHTPGVEVVVLFVADRSVDSLLAARKLRGLLRPARFIIVRNEAVPPNESDRLAKFLYDGLARDGQLVVPVLDEAAAEVVEDRTFSFRRFAEESPAGMPRHIRQALEEFLGRVYRQLDILGLGTDRQLRVAAGG